jgi:hypothetical protein
MFHIYNMSGVDEKKEVEESTAIPREPTKVSGAREAMGAE